MSSAIARKLSRARDCLQQSDAAGAQRMCDEILRVAPNNPEALLMLGIAHLMSDRPREAVLALQHALTTQSRHGAALENLGLAHLMLSEFAQAERAFASAAEIPGAPASVFMRLGAARLNQGRHAEALGALQRALELAPQNADIHLNLGQAAYLTRDAAAARLHFETAMRLAPDHIDAMFNLGVLCLDQGEPATATTWFERVIARQPRHVDALINLGVAYGKQRRFEAATDIFRRAVAVDSSRALAHFSLASACMELGAGPKDEAYMREAEGAARRALALNPDIETYALIAEIYSLRGARDQIVATLQEGYARTRAGRLLGMLLFNLRYVCAWDDWQIAWRDVPSVLEDGGDLGPPFALLCQPTTAAQQLAYTRCWAKSQFTHDLSTDASRPIPAHGTGRLRIGYLSSNFGDHAVSDLLVEVLEQHDRARVEIFAYSSGADDGGTLRKRVSGACEHFIDVARDNDDQAAQRIRSDNLDILVDLNGYTRGARTAVMARRPCSVQIAWLGYPATMGADFIDYLVADSFTVPPGHESEFSECVLRMPHCYLPNDRQRAVAAPLTRGEYGLPGDAVVFCCFNQVYKITPEIFACWMRLLRQTPGSVLWLPEDNRWATERLVQAACEHAIDRARLHFAPRVPDPAQHLARYRAADVALDTFPYTSHATACDAVWSGCPLVGLSGETFASRVSGSVLGACNMSELISHTLDDYERLALRLAADGAYRAELRAKLDATRLSVPLFDSAGFARDLENLYHGVIAGRRA